MLLAIRSAFSKKVERYWFEALFDTEEEASVMYERAVVAAQSGAD